jgi:hypothetical protein
LKTILTFFTKQATLMRRSTTEPSLSVLMLAIRIPG